MSVSLAVAVLATAVFVSVRVSLSLSMYSFVFACVVWDSVRVCVPPNNACLLGARRRLYCLE